MLATLIDAPFDDPDWVFEGKWDGFRMVAAIEDGKVTLYSRNGKIISDSYLPVARALGKIDGDAVIDGELVALDAAGRSRFQLLQNALRGDASDRIPGAAGVGSKTAAALLRKYGSLDELLDAGRFQAQAQQLRLYRSIATMDAAAPLPALRNQKPTWDRAARLARDWGLNKLAERLVDMEASSKPARRRR